MALERSFSRLSLRAQSICPPCRRALSTSAALRQTQQQQQQQQQQELRPPPQRQTATSVVTDLIQSSMRSSNPRTSKAPIPRPSPQATPLELTQRAVRMASLGRREREERQRVEMERTQRRRDLETQSIRRWLTGDVYAPHDLSPVEQSKWRKLRQKPRPKRDVMDQLGINPLDHYKNFSMMSEYITEMGRIKHSKDTNLRPVNQRRMARAIRRAMGIGLIPGVHRHPEILNREREMGSSLR